MHYRAPLEDIQFCLDHMAGREQLVATGAFPHLEDGTAEAVLNEAARTFEEQLGPAQEVADSKGAWLENGVVRTPEAFHRAYAAIRDGGWVGAAADPDFGGMGLPQFIITPINEILSSACISLSLCPLLTQGTITALQLHGTEAQKATYLPRLISGEWAGTMNLTEAHAGSDVGALKTRAEPNADGSWSITGEKIFISWGDSDLTDNIIHMVLARTPDSPPGTRGISLFLVPKFLADESGGHSRRNSLKPLALEAKLGLHGSPTAAMSYEGATGWLVGEERAGMACMFSMMNPARLGVGGQGLAMAESARQLASGYAAERRQGATPEGDGPILGHADVRRMVLEMRTRTQAARALCYEVGLTIDLAAVETDSAARRRAAARASFLTPIAKAFGSDTGCEVASLGIQVHGGAGYIEATGAARILRDARITPIYEGTNGIQALDLVTRKLAPDGGAVASGLIDEVEITANALVEAGGISTRIGQRTRRAVEATRRATGWMVAASEVERQAGATAYLRLFALTRGMHHLGRGALAAPDQPSRVALAGVFAERILPETAGLEEAATAGADGLYSLSDEQVVA